jgi:hypothetical protein
MKITLAFVALVLGWAGAARAQPTSPSCQSFDRASAAAPPLVRSWLAHSGDAHVIVCTPRGVGETSEAEPLYSGESGVSRHGTLCSYLSHGLIRVGSGAGSRLQLYERGDAVGMALADGDCPPPHPAAAGGRYTATYDLSAADFVAIMQLWAAAAASPERFDHELNCCDARSGSPAAANTALAAQTRQRLRSAIESGRMKIAPVLRILRISGHPIRHRYALFVSDPDGRGAGGPLFVIYLSKALGRAYHITAIADAAS